MDKNTKHEKKIREGFPGQKMLVLSPDHVRKMERNPLAKNLYPTAIGHYPNASSHERDRKFGAAQYILLYCVSGKGWLKINREEFILTPNTYYIIPKHTAHRYGSSQKDPWSIYWVHFTGETADLLYARFADNMLSSALSIPYDDRNIHLFDAIFAILGNDLNESEIEVLYIKLIQFLSLFAYPEKAIVKETEDRIAESIAFMKKSLEKNLSVKTLAEQANYSVSRYSELFKARTGYSPIQYFLRLKIHWSCQYLYFTQMNIKEICQKTGFDDPYYFSRMFKKQMNLSPMQYRKKYKV